MSARRVSPPATAAGSAAGRIALAAAGVCLIAACGPKEPPVTAEAVARVIAARQEVIEAAAAARRSSGTVEPAGDEPAGDEAAAQSPSASTRQVTLEPEGGVETPRTLGEAAADERQRRRDDPERASVVITNENLSAFAAPGQVTQAGVPDVSGDPQAAPTGEAAPGEAASAEPLGGPRDEQYWRRRVRDVRARWAAAAEEVATLEEEAAELRWAFYAEDDGYYRDQSIKPEWDRVLDDLRRARQDTRAYRRELADVLADGRAQGAFPGWLRDGIELEPEPPPEDEAEERGTDPREPQIFDERGDDRP